METSELENLAAMAAMFRLGSLVELLVGIVVLVLTARAVHKVCELAQMHYPSRRVLLLQVATMINFGLYIGGATFLVYVVLRPPREILLAIAGSAAVAIGISLKDIVASVVAGIILLFDRPFQVGDRVSFNGSYGEIVRIGLRVVKMVTLDDNLVTIPNSRFLTDVVASGNAGALDMMVVMDFHVDLTADHDLARELVREVVATSRFAYLKKAHHVLVSEVVLGEQFVARIRAKAYVLDCRFEKAFESDVSARVLKEFRTHQIKRPMRCLAQP